MKTDTHIIYNNFMIYLNQWGEYCVCRKLTGRMVSWNAGFSTLKAAKQFVNLINPVELGEKGIEELAQKVRTRERTVIISKK